MNHTPINFRYDIAFLRAFAVVIVVCFHLKVPYFDLGFMGVDVFFVLSGYLITGLLLKHESLSTAAIGRFYLSRIKRILPALLTVLLIFILPIYLLVGIKLYDYSRFALSSVLFISNGYNYLNSGYFDASSELNFLLHTWTLSLEGQFYFLFPLVIWGSRRWLGLQDKHLLLVLSILIVLSFSLMIFLKNRDISYAFYSIESRLWEFLLGSVVFVLAKIMTFKVSMKRRNLFSLAGLLVLGAVVFFPFTHGMLVWPSWITILPVACVAFVLLCKGEIAVFKHPIVLFVASRSYAWYLWHWPLVVLFYYLNLVDLWWIKVLVFLGSLFLANITYLYIERNTYFSKPKRLFAGIALCAMFFFMGTRAVLYDFIFPKKQAELFQFFYHYPRAEAPNQYGFGYAHVRENGSFNEFDKTRLTSLSADSSNYLLLGDCHAGMFATTIKTLAKQQGVHLVQATADDAFPAPAASIPFTAPKELMDYIFNDYLPTHHNQIDRVILMANYAGYTKAELTSYFAHNKRYFEKLKIPIVYISQTEKYALEYPVLKWLQHSVGLEPGEHLLTFPANANQFVKSLVKDANYIDVYGRADKRGVSDSAIYLYDAEHFSVEGTAQLEELLQKGIFEYP